MVAGPESVGRALRIMDGLIKALEARAFKVGISNERRKERERAEMEAAERRWREQEQIKALEREAARWRRGRRIRAYVEAVKEHALRRHGSTEPGSPLDQWLKWAHRYADGIDPLKETPMATGVER